jgi:prolyl 4-hydroxylase
MKLELGNYEMEMIFHDPLIFTLKGVLTDAECQHFIEIAADNLKRSRVSGYDHQEERKDRLDNRRTSSNCWVGHTQDSVTLAVVNRIAELVQIPSSHAESFQVLHYEDSQEYQPHLDTFDPDDKGYLPYLKNGGQRVVTAIAYLSDVIKGGETSFPNLEKIVSPERGKIVVFHLCKKGTLEPNPDALHGGMPVLEGEKWAFNLWFRHEELIKKI